MARTLYLKDGSREVLIAEESDVAVLEQIIQERLGYDAVELFRSVVAECSPPDDYEMACDSYRTCLQDALDDLKSLKSMLETPRSDRRKALRSLERTITRINDEL